jgi:thiol:disulfide interchange protein DsbD
VQQTLAVGMLIFACAGVGMGVPYVLLAAQPAWIKVIPRPGPWMTTFEHLMGFLLLGMGIWLLEAIPVQIGADGLQMTLVFLLLVAIAAWVYGRLGFDAPVARKVRTYGIIAVLVVGGWVLCFRVLHTIPQLAEAQKALRMGSVGGVAGWSEGVPWTPYTQQRAMDAVAAGKTVFIDYSAEWCKSCLANEKFVLNSSAVREAMKRLGVLPLKADFTSFDPEIKKDLERFGRSGVPMYVVIPAGRSDEPILLDELITPSSVIAALEKAGASKAAGEGKGNADAGNEGKAGASFCAAR